MTQVTLKSVWKQKHVELANSLTKLETELYNHFTQSLRETIARLECPYTQITLHVPLKFHVLSNMALEKTVQRMATENQLHDEIKYGRISRNSCDCNDECSACKVYVMFTLPE